MSTKRQYPFPYKTVANENTLEVSEISIENITIQSPTSYPTYTLTLPPNDGNPGQILSTNGSGVLSWVNDISGGTVTSVSASVPSWLSVTVTNPTTTPAIAITGSSTGTGTVSVLQDSPTINNTLTVSDKIDIPRNNGSGEAIRIHNANTSFPNDDYVAIGHNSNARNHAHFGHTIVANNDPNNYAYIETNNNRFIFNGLANFKLPITTGTAGQALITDGSGNTSWTTVGTVTSVSATVPAWLSVTVTNPTTTPAIAISGTSTGTGDVVLATSPTIVTPTMSNFARVDAASGPNDAGTLMIRGGSDVYLMKYKPGAVGTSNNAFMITTNPANSSNTFFYSQGSSVGIFSHAPQETLDVQGSIRASSFVRFNNVFVYPGSNAVLSLYLPTTTGTSGQVLTSTGSGTAMIWTTPTTGTVTSVTATSPVVSSGGSTPDISLSTVPTSLGGTGLTTVGTNGQVLTSNGSSLLWQTPATGTVTSVSATSPLASSGGATPTISISSSTGTGAVVLQDSPTITTGLTISVPTTGNVGLTVTNSSRSYLLSTSLSNQFQIRDVTGNAQRMVINSSGNIGFGTSPNTSYRILAGQGAIGALATGSNNITVIAQTAPGNASFRSINDTRTYSIGIRGDTNDVFAITDDTANAFRMVIDTSGNVGIGTTTPSARLSVAGEGRILELNGSTQSYLDFDISSTLGLQMGFIYTGDPSFYITQKRNGPIEFYHDGTSGKVTNFYMPVTTRDYLNISKPGTGVNTEITILSGSVGSPSVANTSTINFGTVGGGGGTVFNTLQMKYAVAYGYHLLATADTFVTSGPIALNSTVTLKIAPSSSTFDFILPSSPGTAGQYLISGGAGAAMYWGSGGGGGGGSVNSVTASLPLASSGGTAPNISIANATGTGAVVLAQGPQFVSGFSIRETSTDTTAPITCGNGQFLSIEAHNGLNTVKRPIVLNGYGGNVGINTTTPTVKLHVVQDAAADVALIENSNAAGFAAIHCKTTTNNTFIGVGGTTSYLPNLFYIDHGGATRFTINNTGNVGIGTTSPAEKLHVVGTVRVAGAAINQNGATSTFSNGSYSDPDNTQAYNAKFGNTDPNSNGIAVKGNSRFAGIVVATAGFTNNITDIFTYSAGSFTPRLGAFRRPTGLLYELGGSLPGPCSITATYSVQNGYFVKMGKNLTINLELRWTINTGGVGPDDYDYTIILPDSFNSPNTSAVTGACLQFPNSIGSITNPMGILLQYPVRATGGNVSAIWPTTSTGTIAYPIFPPGGTQILQFAFSWATTS